MNDTGWRRYAAIGFFAALLMALPAHAASVLNAEAAKAVFAEAKAVSDKDGGALWSMKLFGPIMLVDPETRTLIASEPDETLKAQDGVFVGTMPKDMLPANTALDWHGKRWTMLQWPVWGDRQEQARLLAHEMFHHLQPALHLHPNDVPNPHLDTLEGRLWLQLEWRALAVALTSTGKARTDAIRDALAFRARRTVLFPGAAEHERGLELNEGVAEYTGLRVASADTASAHWIAAGKLLSSKEKTWVRSFPYVSGPAYGLLLDDLAPGWRAKLTVKSDLSVVLAAALPKGAAVDAVAHAKRYGEAELRLIETERAAANEAVRKAYRAKLVDGPVLVLPNLGQHFNVSFDPREVVPLDEAGTVYPTITVSDDWGSLAVKEGALLSPDWQRINVSAPASSTERAGAGWTLTLAPGWTLVPTDKPGSFTVKKD
jgi:hypothetical protein